MLDDCIEPAKATKRVAVMHEVGSGNFLISEETNNKKACYRPRSAKNTGELAQVFEPYVLRGYLQSSLVNTD